MRVEIAVQCDEPILRDGCTIEDMARVFISSTFVDLKDYRKAVYVALRRLGHQSIAMEDWTATDQPPIEKSVEDLRGSDFCIFIIAWRYGYVPAGQRLSITEVELRAAREAGIPCLIFLAGEDAPWPKKYVDKDPTEIREFRQRIREQYLVAFFSNPDELATQVAVALHQWVASGASEPSRNPLETIPVFQTTGPEVFVSYAHQDVAVAKSLAERIGRERWSVFWDREIPVGLTWDEIVESALDAAKCVVVLWSAAARDSDWVRIEATEGAERGILAPALIEETKIPLRFRGIQAANLVGWNNALPDAPGMLALISAVGRCVSGKNRARTSKG